MSRFQSAQNQVHNRAMAPMDYPRPDNVLGVWQSRDYLAALWQEDNGHQRLSVNRTQTDSRTGTWRDGITWDDLMKVKSECGLGDSWAVEIYPPRNEVVNAAAMRHLWILDAPPPFAWRKDES